MLGWAEVALPKPSFSGCFSGSVEFRCTRAQAQSAYFGLDIPPKDVESEFQGTEADGHTLYDERRVVLSNSAISARLVHHGHHRATLSPHGPCQYGRKRAYNQRDTAVLSTSIAAKP